MGKCSKNNKIIQITLDKDLLLLMDNICKQLSKDKKRNITRSMFIQDILIMTLNDAGKKGNKKDGYDF